MASTRYVAFLRAVNVGGRIVKMEELKRIFESLGVARVSTFIASGNVIFESPHPASKLEPRIEGALHKALGYPVTTMLRSTDQVVEVAGYKAFPEGTVQEATVYVGFTRTIPTPAAVKKTLALQTDIDRLHLNGGEIYWLARNSIAEASISMSSIERALQTPVTFRNLNTVRRLVAKYGTP